MCRSCYHALYTTGINGTVIVQVGPNLHGECQGVSRTETGLRRMIMGDRNSVARAGAVRFRSNSLPLAVLVLLLAAHSGRAEAVVVHTAQQMGVLQRVTGSVSIEGASVLPGATVMSGDVMATGANSTARLLLRSGEWASVRPDSQLLVSPGTQSPNVELRRGSVLVGRQSTDEMRIDFPGAWILVKGSSSAGALCEVESTGTSSQVTLIAGLAEIHAAGDPVLLHPGQLARLDLGSAALPQSAAPAGGVHAGSVTRQIPDGSVQRGGQEKPLVLHDPVEWNDVVHTLGKGRLEIKLVDGSVLTVGARSEMKVLKHDAQAQVTQIELLGGQVRANVAKITKSGGKFEVRTKTAVIGVVGTTFLADVVGTTTRVCGVEGVTEVISATLPGAAPVYLHKGQCTIVALGSAPTPPANMPELLNELMNGTNMNIAGAVGGAGAVHTAATLGGVKLATIITIAAVTGGTVGGLFAAGVIGGSSGTKNLSVP